MGATVDVILPAGGRIRGAFAAQTGVRVKALLPVGERTVLERTLEALRACERVRRLVVIGPQEVATHPGASEADAVLADTGSGVGNVFRGLDWLADNGGEGGRLLILATDLPLLTASSVTSFLDACPPEADVAAPVTRREAFEARFPGNKRRFVRLADGSWVLGCAFLVNPQVMARLRAHTERVFAARKAAAAILVQLGPAFLARFLAGRLSIAQIEERCQHILGCRALAVRDSPPELAFDIDRPQDYRYALSQ
jgi:molybdopterin-guanine dinucleotide biosynthesis protein A